MIRKIIDNLIDIFIIPDEDIKLNEIYLDKTQHYKKEIKEFFLDSVFVCLEYNQNLKKLLKSYKYDYNKKLHLDFEKYFINYGEIFLKEMGDSDKNFIVVGIPLYFLNFLKRGYNQTYLLAKGFANVFGFEFKEILFKRRYTGSQSRLDRNGRLDNLKNAFGIKKKYLDKIRGKTVIIIDDVISSGTTSNEVAKILKENGAKKVIGLFLASGN